MKNKKKKPAPAPKKAEKKPAKTPSKSASSSKPVKKAPVATKPVKAAKPAKSKPVVAAKNEKVATAEKSALKAKPGKAKAEKVAAPAKVTVEAAKALKKESDLKETKKPAKTKPAKTASDFQDDLAGDAYDYEGATEVDPDEVILTDADGRVYCKVKECDQLLAVGVYCRYHYLLLWKKIQLRKKILVDGKLEKYIEDLTNRYPDKYIEMIRKDLKTEKDFLAAVQELEIDDSGVDADLEEESENLMDEVRGMGSGTGTRTGDDDY